VLTCPKKGRERERREGGKIQKAAAFISTVPCSTQLYIEDSWTLKFPA